MTYREFKCFGVSSNMNSFGLYGHRFMSRDGEFWEVAGNSLNKKSEGDVLRVPCVKGRPQWHHFGFEIPERKEPDAPPKVIQAVWGD